MHLVKMITNDDGDEHESKDWHLVRGFGDGNRTVCTGEVFGEGEGIAKFKEKHVGKITCKRCIETVKWFKAIKL